MVNQIIVDYLKNNKDKYPIEALKQQIISSGYSETEINEAVEALKLPEEKKVEEIKTETIKKESFVIHEEKKFKFMNFAGYSGFSITFFIIIIFILLLLDLPGQGVIFGILLSLSLISSMIFFLGFFKLGKTLGKLMRVSSMAILILNALILIFLLISGISAYSSLSTAMSSEAGLGDLITDLIVIIVIFSFFMVLFFVFYLLFFISLIRAGEVKFARVAGILGIILLGLMLISIGLLFLMSANVILIINLVMGLAVLVLCSLALRDASKNYENSGY